MQIYIIHYVNTHKTSLLLHLFFFLLSNFRYLRNSIILYKFVFRWNHFDLFLYLLQFLYFSNIIVLTPIFYICLYFRSYAFILLISILYIFAKFLSAYNYAKFLVRVDVFIFILIQVQTSCILLLYPVLSVIFLRSLLERRNWTSQLFYICLCL